jgi:hypothetical protein
MSDFIIQSLYVGYLSSYCEIEVLHYSSLHGKRIQFMHYSFLHGKNYCMVRKERESWIAGSKNLWKTRVS